MNVFVQVRFPDSEFLSIEDWPFKNRPSLIEQASKSTKVRFFKNAKGELTPAYLKFRIVAPDFSVEGESEKMVEVPPKSFSELISFQLIPKFPGVHGIMINVCDENGVSVGEIPVETDVNEKETPPVKEATIVILALNVLVDLDPAIVLQQDEYLDDKTIIRTQPSKRKPDSTAPTGPKPPEPIAPDLRKTNNALKFAALAGIILLLIAGIWWWASQQQVNEVRQKIEKINKQVLGLEDAVSNIDKPEQIKEFTRQADTLNSQVAALSEKATKVGFRSELEDLQKRLERVQIQLANKEKELITALIGMKFVLIPAGKFVMGSPPNEFGRINDERQHEVIISKSFYLQTTEVSQAQWKRIMGDNPSEFKNCGDCCPVERITWDEAQKFIKKLNQMEGTDKYRLPTEAEWEYACRAKTETAYSFGDEVDKLGQYAWYQDNSKGQTHPVGEKKPNAWGLYDMLGNVWEWCQDWYGDYPSSSVADPKGPDKGEYRVMRGGSWSSLGGFLRSANRYQHDPVYAYFHWSGFRVARDL
jgi:formylglycine-generating enzyme required for sulfatase activity